MVLALGLVLGFRPRGGVVGVLLAVALVIAFSFSLAWVWTALSLVLRTPGSVMGVSSFILFPLTFVSNVFVDPSTMPGPLAAFVDVNPISLLTTAARGLMHGTPVGSEVGWVLFCCVALVAVFGPVTMFLYRAKE
jgi:ABC-2 type transport system permease protein